jgi:hypothetical protein
MSHYWNAGQNQHKGVGETKFLVLNKASQKCQMEQPFWKQAL